MRRSEPELLSRLRSVIPINMSQVIALTKRDFHNFTTYKSAALMTLAGTLLGVVSWGLSATYRNRAVTYGLFTQYNTDYVSFLVTGIIIANLIMPLGQGVSKGLNPQTLENVLMSGMSTPTFVLGQVLWSYILSVIFLFPQLFVGVYFFGAQLNINYISLGLCYRDFHSSCVFLFDNIYWSEDSHEGK